jgi:GTP-binding protein EngB required for normal cell division
MNRKYVVFTGRPNSGKSSTIRALTGLKVTRGKKPGTTTKINYYPIARGLILIDMPGYGRKVGASKKWEDETKNAILNFLEKNSQDILVSLHVLNILTFIEVEKRMSRKGFINLDIEMITYLHEITGDYPLIVANKIDKGKEEDVAENLRAFISTIGVSDPTFIDNVFPVSAKKGIGIGLLKNSLMRRLASGGFSRPFELIN